jgi:hypothetical protein
MLIDEAGPQSPRAMSGKRWAIVTDTVMGGVSHASLSVECLDGRPALRMTGEVRLENRGGFVQLALDLGGDEGPLDASAYTGLELSVIGNGATYGLHLRTLDQRHPWESYRHAFTAGPCWSTVQLPFAGFVAHRCTVPLDLRRLRRLGLVAIGRAFHADLALGRLALY